MHLFVGLIYKVLNITSGWWQELSSVALTNNLVDQLQFTVYLLWQIWKARNRWLYHYIWTSEFEVVQRAHVEWLEFDNAQEKCLSANSNLVLEPSVVLDVPSNDLSRNKVYIATA